MVGGAVDRLCGEEEEEMAFMEELKNSTNGSDIDSFCAIEVASALSFIGGLMQVAILSIVQGLQLFSMAF